MAWNTTLGITIRQAIGDFTSPPKYTDVALAPLILTAIQAISFNIVPSYPYKVNIEANTLMPDPTDSDIADDGFVHLVTLKAAAMLLRSEVRVYGQQAISIRDGTSAIDLKRDLRTLSALADSYESDLTKAIDYYIRNNTIGGMAVISPYPNLMPRIDGYFHDTRSCRR